MTSKGNPKVEGLSFLTNGAGFLELSQAKKWKSPYNLHFIQKLTQNRHLSSVQFISLSHVWLFATPWTAARQGVCSDSYPSSLWCHPTILFFVVPFSSCFQSFPASGSFPMSQFFVSGSQSIRVLASASVFPMNIQKLFPLGLSGLISLGLSRVFSNTTVQRHILKYKI